MGRCLWFHGVSRRFRAQLYGRFFCTSFHMFLKADAVDWMQGVFLCLLSFLGAAGVYSSSTFLEVFSPGSCCKALLPSRGFSRHPRAMWRLLLALSGSALANDVNDAACVMQMAMRARLTSTNVSFTEMKEYEGKYCYAPAAEMPRRSSGL